MAQLGDANSKCCSIWQHFQEFFFSKHPNSKILFTKVVTAVLLFVRCFCWLKQLKHTPYPVKNKSGWCIFSLELQSSTSNRETLWRYREQAQVYTVVSSSRKYAPNLFFVVCGVRFNSFNQQNQRTNTGTSLRTL